MTKNKVFSWGIIGGGPAGMAAIGKLIDNGVKASEIIWIDPHFDVGLLGRKWQSVWSNTRVKLFEDFLNACQSFNYKACPTRYPLHDLPPMDTCQLKHIVEPLKWVTQELKTKVETSQSTVERLDRDASQNAWVISSTEGPILSKNCVLATGSNPKEMVCSSGPQLVPLDEALQFDVLGQRCTENDTVAVFGSSHSAIMIVRDLLEHKVKKVLNFYRSDLIFAEYVEAGIVNDSTGLKGKTAEWARKNLVEGPSPPSLERLESTDENVKKALPSCSKVIYAIGFDPVPIKVNGSAHISYDTKTGEIQPGLYGCGIAFPEHGPDAAGKIEAQVGLWKFMRYLNRVVPEVWLKTAHQ